MSMDIETVRRDMSILEEMVAELPAYLLSEATHWPMEKSDLPKLTIGGCLMRRHRLQALHEALPLGEQLRSKRVLAQLAAALAEKVVRLEHRVHQELHARLSQWAGYISRTKSQMATDAAYYASVVDTRVVITAMVDTLSQPPYRLEEQILREMNGMDLNLHNHWEEGPFVWPEVWLPAYPHDKYWWLYGRPKEPALRPVAASEP